MGFVCFVLLRVVLEAASAHLLLLLLADGHPLVPGRVVLHPELLKTLKVVRVVVRIGRDGCVEEVGLRVRVRRRVKVRLEGRVGWSRSLALLLLLLLLLLVLLLAESSSSSS